MTHLTISILLCACICGDVLYSISFCFHFLLISFLFIPLLPVPSSSPFLSCRHIYFFFCISLIYLVIYLFLFSLIYSFKLSYYMFSCFISSTNNTAGAHVPCYFIFFLSLFAYFSNYLFSSTFSFLFLILSFLIHLWSHVHEQSSLLIFRKCFIMYECSYTGSVDSLVDLLCMCACSLCMHAPM